MAHRRQTRPFDGFYRFHRVGQASLKAEVNQHAAIIRYVDYSQWCKIRLHAIAYRMDIGAVVGKNIVRIRNRQNVSQEELAFRADIDRSYLSQIESGKRNPSLKLLANLARSLNVEVVDFLVDDGMTPNAQGSKP